MCRQQRLMALSCAPVARSLLRMLRCRPWTTLASWRTPTCEPWAQGWGALRAKGAGLWRPAGHAMCWEDLSMSQALHQPAAQLS